MFCDLQIWLYDFLYYHSLFYEVFIQFKLKKVPICIECDFNLLEFCDCCIFYSIQTFVKVWKLNS